MHLFLVASCYWFPARAILLVLLKTGAAPRSQLKFMWQPSLAGGMPPVALIVLAALGGQVASRKKHVSVAKMTSNHLQPNSNGLQPSVAQHMRWSNFFSNVYADRQAMSFRYFRRRLPRMHENIVM